MFALSLVDFLSLLWNPSTNIEIFIFVRSINWMTHTNSKKMHVVLNFEWGLKDQYWLSWELLPFEFFFNILCDVHLGITYANMLVTTQWPLNRAAHLTSLVWVCVVWRSESLIELYALWLPTDYKIRLEYPCRQTKILTRNTLNIHDIVALFANVRGIKLFFIKTNHNLRFYTWTFIREIPFEISYIS